MGVTITATNSKYSFDMGGGGFLSLRVNIAKAMDRELGEHYAARSDGRDYEHFKDFLQECYTHRREMRWS